jgi:hypothetical protein
MTMAESGDQSGLQGQAQVGTPSLPQMNLGSGNASVLPATLPATMSSSKA